MPVATINRTLKVMFSERPGTKLQLWQWWLRADIVMAEGNSRPWTLAAPNKKCRHTRSRPEVKATTSTPLRRARNLARGADPGGVAGGGGLKVGRANMEREAVVDMFAVLKHMRGGKPVVGVLLKASELVACLGLAATDALTEPMARVLDKQGKYLRHIPFGGTACPMMCSQSI